MLIGLWANTAILKLCAAKVGSGIAFVEHERGWVELSCEEPLKKDDMSDVLGRTKWCPNV